VFRVVDGGEDENLIAEGFGGERGRDGVVRERVVASRKIGLWSGGCGGSWRQRRRRVRKKERGRRGRRERTSLREKGKT